MMPSQQSPVPIINNIYTLPTNPQSLQSRYGENWQKIDRVARAMIAFSITPTLKNETGLIADDVLCQHAEDLKSFDFLKTVLIATFTYIKSSELYPIPTILTCSEQMFQIKLLSDQIKTLLSIGTKTTEHIPTKHQSIYADLITKQILDEEKSFILTSIQFFLDHDTVLLAGEYSKCNNDIHHMYEKMSPFFETKPISHYYETKTLTSNILESFYSFIRVHAKYALYSATTGNPETGLSAFEKSQNQFNELKETLKNDNTSTKSYPHKTTMIALDKLLKTVKQKLDNQHFIKTQKALNETFSLLNQFTTNTPAPTINATSNEKTLLTQTETLKNKVVPLQKANPNEETHNPTISKNLNQTLHLLTLFKQTAQNAPSTHPEIQPCYQNLEDTLTCWFKFYANAKKNVLCKMISEKFCILIQNLANGLPQDAPMPESPPKGFISLEELLTRLSLKEHKPENKPVELDEATQNDQAAQANTVAKALCEQEKTEAEKKKKQEQTKRDRNQRKKQKRKAKKQKAKIKHTKPSPPPIPPTEQSSQVKQPKNSMLLIPTPQTESQKSTHTKHLLSHQHIAITSKAEFILSSLNHVGFDAFIVGGYVRDTLLKIPPNDIDIVTNCPQERLPEIFENLCKPDLMSPSLSHIGENVDIVSNHNKEGHLDLKADARTRDITINALYADKEGQLYDPLENIQDIRAPELKVISDTNRRFWEDPSRILRLMRYAKQVSKAISIQDMNAIDENASLLQKVPLGIFMKHFGNLFSRGKAQLNYQLLCKLCLLPALFPPLGNKFGQNPSSPSLFKFWDSCLNEADNHYQENKTALYPPDYYAALFLLYSITNKTDISKMSAEKAFETTIDQFLKSRQSEQDCKPDHFRFKKAVLSILRGSKKHPGLLAKWKKFNNAQKTLEENQPSHLKLSPPTSPTAPMAFIPQPIFTISPHYPPPPILLQYPSYAHHSTPNGFTTMSPTQSPPKKGSRRPNSS